MLQQLSVVVLSLAAAEVAKPPSSSGRAQKHWWPHCHGHVGNYTHSQFMGPPSLVGSLKWMWHDPVYEVMLGSVIDYDRNVYVSNTNGIRKFSPDGNLLWYYRPLAEMKDNPSLMDDAIYGGTWHGHLFAVNISSGRAIWNTQAFVGRSEQDCAYVEAHDGVVLAAFDRQMREGKEGNVRIVAANATDGTKLWEYVSDAILWNFKASFLDDGTFLAYDIYGAVRKLRVSDGSLVWHANVSGHCGVEATTTFSDGGATTTPDGTLVYTCANVWAGSSGSPGILRAFRTSDGQVQWEQVLPFPCVSWPAVDSLGKSVAVVIGAFPRTWEVTAVGTMMFDALTGGSLWSFFDMQPLFHHGAAGEFEHYGVRNSNKWSDRDVCGPASWGAPVIDGNGTVFAGNHVGDLWAVNDFNGDGIVKPGEYQSMAIGAASLHCGAGFAPGMMVYTSCSTLYIFQY